MIRLTNSRIRDHRRSGNEDGFTLLEVLISTVILAVGLLGVAAMQLNAIQGNAFAHKMNDASERIQTKIEEFRTRPFEDVQSEEEDEDEDGFTRVSVVQDDTPIAGAKTIVVTVSWRDNTTTGEHDISFRTIIAQQGEANP